MSARHDPVLVREVLGFLLRGGAGLYLDATLGDGGHAQALLDADSGVRLLGCDRDPAALAFSRERLARFGARVTLRQSTFRELPAAHAAAGGEALAGVLMDLGLSSRQIEDPARGISFASEGPLDMRMDPTSGTPLSERLAGADAEEVASALRTHGDVSGAGRLARAIVEAAREGRLSTTRDLVDCLARAGGEAHPKRLAPVFQALRIWVNDEMADLEGALAWLPAAVREDGIVVTLAYHSGEDRRVKHAMRGAARTVPSRRLPERDSERAPESPWEELTRKVVVPTRTEELANPRARSARLRAYRRKSR